jgi:hypothetical protein
VILAKLMMLRSGSTVSATLRMKDIPGRSREDVALRHILLRPIGCVRQTRIQSFHCGGEGWSEETRKAHARFFARGEYVLILVLHVIAAYTLTLIKEWLDKSGPSRS